ncbi:MAG: hypothetical protein HYV63_16825 [Candidatus Schekmanbacteria bacterium]|nr:hypothetical protein [Candidatus Schekmanbacteria bacterium]
MKISRAQLAAILPAAIGFFLHPSPSHAQDWQTHAASLSYANAISATSSSLWVATDGALIRWDTASRTYQLFTVPGTDLPARTYERVSVAANGDLWAAGVEFGGANAIAEVFLTQLTDGRLWRHRDSSDGVPAYRPNGDTLGDLQGAPAYLVAMSKGRLLTATDNSLQEKVLLLGSPPPDLNDVAVDPSGGTWLALYGTGAAYLLGDEITILTPADGLCSTDMLAVAVAPDGAVWFASYGGGICRRYQDVWTTWTAAAGGLSGDYFTDIAVEPDGTVWAATDSMGAVRYDGSAWQSFGTANGMPDDHVVALAPHPQQGMYLATRDAGVAFYDGTAWQTFAVPPTIPSDRTWAIATHRPASCSPAPVRRRAPCDEVWIGTDFGAAYSSNGTWTTYTTDSGLPGDAIWAIAVDAAGLAWLGIGGEGVAHGRGDTWTTYSPADGIPSTFIRDLAVTPAGTVWVSTDSGVARFDGSAWSAFTTAGGLGSDDAWGIGTSAQPGSDTVWIATGSTVSEWNGASWIVHPVAESVPDLSIRDVLLQETGELWAATSAGAAVRRPGETSFRMLARRDGLPSDNVLSLGPAAFGGVWVGTDKGVVLWNDGAFSTPITGRDGLIDAAVWVIATGADGRTWFGTDYGVSVLASEPMKPVSLYLDEPGQDSCAGVELRWTRYISGGFAGYEVWRVVAGPIAPLTRASSAFLLLGLGGVAPLRRRRGSTSTSTLTSTRQGRTAAGIAGLAAAAALAAFAPHGATSAASKLAHLFRAEPERLVVISDIDTPRYYDADLADGLAYQYFIRVQRRDEASVDSLPTSYLREMREPPLASGLSLKSVGTTNADLSIGVPRVSSCGPDSYRLYRQPLDSDGESIGDAVPVADIPLSQSDFADSGLASGSRYRYDLRSLRGSVESSVGRELVVETQRPIDEEPGDCVPHAPEHLDAEASKVRAQLDWRSADAAADCAEDTYNVYRSANGGGEASVATVGRGSPRYVDHDVSPGSAYTYRVRAVRNGKKSAPSSSATVTIPRERVVLEVPGTVAFTDTGITLDADAAVRVSYLRGAVQFHTPSEASSVSASGLTRSSFYLDWDLDVQACDDPLAGASDAHAMLIARAGGDVVPVGRGARIAGVSGTLELGINDCSLQGQFGNAGAWTVEITEE